MVTYKAVNADSLDADLTTVANAIRSKTGKNEDLEFPEGFVSEVESIQQRPDYLAKYLNKSLKEYTSAELPSSLPRTLFSNRTDIVSVTLPNWESGGSYAFSGCASLATVNCPGLKAVGDYCFLECSSLSRIELPSATYISAGAFMRCGGLATVILGREDSTNVVTLQNANAFEGTLIASDTADPEKIGIYVPDGLFSEYTKEGTNWYTYASKIKKLSTYTGN